MWANKPLLPLTDKIDPYRERYRALEASNCVTRRVDRRSPAALRLDHRTGLSADRADAIALKLNDVIMAAIQPEHVAIAEGLLQTVEGNVRNALNASGADARPRRVSKACAPRLEEELRSR